MAQSIETIAGRDGLIIPVMNTRGVHSSVFPQFFQSLNKLNDLGLHEGSEVFLPPATIPDSDRLRPALLLRYAKESLSEQEIERNRQGARPGSSDWGHYREYTKGSEQYSVMEIPTRLGPIKELVAVRRAVRSQELVIGFPNRRNQSPASIYWQGTSVDNLLTTREEQLPYPYAHTSALSRFFKRTIKLFVT